MELALGFMPHTGWAVAVLVTGSAIAPDVLGRWRVALCPDDLPRQVFHAAQGLARSEAMLLVAEVDAAVQTTTASALADLLAEASTRGDLVAVGLVGQPRVMPDLDSALSNHSMLHAAEGELYRGALDDAAEAQGLAAVPVATKQSIQEAAAALGTPPDALAARLAELRSTLGAPWRADHKAATAAALVALHAS